MEWNDEGHSFIILVQGTTHTILVNKDIYKYIKERCPLGTKARIKGIFKQAYQNFMTIQAYGITVSLTRVVEVNNKWIDWEENYIFKGCN